MQPTRSAFLAAATMLLAAAPVASALAMSPVIHPKIAAGEIRVVAARYAFESGRAAFLG